MSMRGVSMRISTHTGQKSGKWAYLTQLRAMSVVTQGHLLQRIPEKGSVS